mgnify:CR=1 FL=1
MAASTGSIADLFADLPDPRLDRNKKHGLDDILTIGSNGLATSLLNGHRRSARLMDMQFTLFRWVAFIPYGVRLRRLRYLIGLDE